MEAMERGLTAIVGKKYISTEDLERWCYSRDFSPELPKMPSFVVMPQNSDQVSAIIKLANQTKTPIWPRGGGTSSCTSAMPLRQGGILLDLTRMNKIVEINEENMTATVQPAVVLRTLEEETQKEEPASPEPWLMWVRIGCDCGRRDCHFGFRVGRRRVW